MKYYVNGLFNTGESTPLEALETFIKEAKKEGCTDYEMSLESHKNETLIVLKVSKEI